MVSLVQFVVISIGIGVSFGEIVWGRAVRDGGAVVTWVGDSIRSGVVVIGVGVGGG